MGLLGYLTGEKMHISEYEDYLKLESGTVLVDNTIDDVRYIIMRGPCSLCAYVGIPKGHPLAGVNYDNLYNYQIPRVHGGLTFSDWGNDKYFPNGYWWIGWDYAHYGDMAFFDYGSYSYSETFPWTVSEVEAEIKNVLPEFKTLLEETK
jgi:hypothetical protein